MSFDPEEQWGLVTQLWDELDVEHILAEHIPLERRWQLDRLVERIRRLDEILKEIAYVEAVMDGDEDSSGLVD
jgi:hypothetical protein